MSYLRGPDRSEVQLLPPCLDDYVAPNAPARFIDAYVEGLDFQGLGLTHAQPAATGRPPYHPADQLGQLLQKIEARIDEYLSELDRQDTQAEGVPAAPSRQELQEKIAQLKEHHGRYDQLLGQLQASGQNEISLTDPDSRKMKGAHGEHFISYNVQVAVDAKHDLIVAEEVVQAANDRGQLAGLAKSPRGADARSIPTKSIYTACLAGRATEVTAAWF